MFSRTTLTELFAESVAKDITIISGIVTASYAT
jgi:hypothetical protein